jgi:hypothetical protein
MNDLDLGYYNAIQSLQHRKHTNTIPELVKAVEDSVVELDRQTLNKVFLTHQQCLEQIILGDTTTTYILCQNAQIFHKMHILFPNGESTSK